jgi:6,7-dimethyl-8-ribityllumazine synthase
LAPRSTQAYAIVASQYNLEFTQPLVDHASRELAILEQGAIIQTVWAPGSFEIPVLVKLLASQSRFDAVIAFGVLFEGETAHAALVAQAVTNALQTVAIETGVPVLDGVLLLNSPEQAHARCVGLEKNRGVEAARAAISVARCAREILAK